MAKAKKELQPVNRRIVTVRLIGISPLIQHRWSEKAKQMMRDKQQKVKTTKTREIRDPDAEGIAAGYYTDDGKPGVLAVALKNAVVTAAHNDLGIPRTTVRKALFIYPNGRDVVIPMETADGNGEPVPSFEEDMVRVGQGSADLRYRPYFYDWAVTCRWELDVDILQTSELLTLLDRAGFGIGIHEWRPEKNGDYGRFKVDNSFEVLEEAADN